MQVQPPLCYCDTIGNGNCKRDEETKPEIIKEGIFFLNGV